MPIFLVAQERAKLLTPDFAMSLWDLCIDGEWDLALVRAALERGDVDVNKRSLHNMTLLMWAAADNKISLLKLLLQQPSIEVNLAADHGFTALHMAVSSGSSGCSGSIEALRTLLMDPRVDVNCKTERMETPLNLATKDADSFDKLELLLADPRVDVDCLASYSGMEASLLMSAALSSNLKAAKVLLDNERVDVNWLNNRDASALHLLAAFPDSVRPKGLLELLLSHPRVDVNCKRGHLGLTALHTAAFNNNVESVRLILAEPRFTSHNDLDGDDGTTALGLAASEGHWDSVKELVQHPKVDLAAGGLGPDDLIR